MSTFEAIVRMPTFGTDDFFTLIGAMADPEHAGPSPYLVIEDEHGSYSRNDPPKGQPFPHPSMLGVCVVVEADDPLQAATDLVARLAEIMDSLRLRAHYPTIRELNPLPSRRGR